MTTRPFDHAQVGAYIAAQVRLRRSALGLSLRQLAARGGCPTPTLSRIEQGENISINTLYVLAEQLGCGVADLLPPDGRGHEPLFEPGDVAVLRRLVLTLERMTKWRTDE